MRARDFIGTQAECWGAGEFGVLGNQSFQDQTTPVPVMLSTVTQIRIGHEHTCALDSTGALFCWGDNSYGQIGIGTWTRKLVPTPVPLP